MGTAGNLHNYGVDQLSLQEGTGAVPKQSSSESVSTLSSSPSPLQSNPQLPPYREPPPSYEDACRMLKLLQVNENNAVMPPPHVSPFMKSKGRRSIRGNHADNCPLPNKRPRLMMTASKSTTLDTIPEEED